MELSSPRFKALATSAGISFWFSIIISSMGLFSYEIILSFIISIVILTQIFAIKLTKGLDIFAIYNTKVFLGILFLCVFCLYSGIFKILKIDLLRLKKKDSYWLDMEELEDRRIFKQY
tara:strand:- start:606 stop:959 length:354 start_codon:yes stop_codon:yes gene_type:complete